MLRLIKKRDFFLIVFFLSVSLLLATIFCFLSPNTKNGEVVITVDGAIYKTFGITQNEGATIEIKTEYGINAITIVDGKVKMTAADCPDGLCLSQRAISLNHQTIVCLPNVLVVEIKNSFEKDIDVDIIIK